MNRSRNGTIGAVLAAVALAGPAAAIVPERVSTSGLGEAPDSGLYIDRSFTPVKTAADVAYGQSVNFQGVLQEHRLDVWEPAGHDDEQFRPAVVWVHGGGFTHGDKDGVAGRGHSLLMFAPYLMERGYVVVSVNYRLRPHLPGGFNDYVEQPTGIPETVPTVRDAIEDAQAAVRWVRANAADHRIDPGQVSVAGWSAGGITAAGVAYDSDNPGASGNPGWDSHVAAALVGAGAYLPVALGDPIKPGDPPAAFFHAAQDMTVPMPAALPFCLNTIAMGNVCEGHLWPGESDHDLVPHLEEIGDLAADFLHRHVIQAERTPTSLTDLTTSAHGSTVTVTGRLVEHDPRPLIGGDHPVTGARILAQATAGWAETTTGDDGAFTLSVDAPDHGQATDVMVRYEGRHPNRPTLPTAPTPLAPTHRTVTATWGAVPLSSR